MIMLQILIIFLLITILAIISFIDYKHQIIPDFLLIIIFFLSLGAQFYWKSSLFLLILGGILHYGSVFFKKRAMIGLGDIKMMGALGLWLQISQIPEFLIFSGIAGILTSFFFKSQYFPFAPSLSFGFFLSFFLPGLEFTCIFES